MNDILDGNDQLSDNNAADIDYLSELTGPGKKFDRTKYQSDSDLMKALAKGKYESDRYIPLLERRQDEFRDDILRYREESNTRAKLEEVIDKLTRQNLTSSNNTQVNEDTKPATVDPDHIKNIVRSEYQEIESQRRQDTNNQMVRDKLIERYGSDYRNVLRQQISELDITDAEFNLMAKTQPKLLIKTLGLDAPAQRENFQSPPRSSQRNDNFAPKTAKRTWQYYEDLRKKDPVAYLSPKTTVQMMKDYEELGSDFEDGDFHA